MNNPINISPSLRLKSFLSYAKMYVITTMMSIINVSMNIMLVVFMGLIVLVNPKINSTLNIELPIALPIAISVFLLYAAVTLVISSGRLVPMDTIVRPTNVSLIPRLNAMSFDDSTTKFPPSMIPIIPTTI